MKYRVHVTASAEADIANIIDYIAGHDSTEAAEHVLDKLEELCLSLELNPSRGNIPAELARISVRNYRQIHFKPYRIVFSIEGSIVYVQCVLDGRRDLQDLLERRLLR